MTPRRIQTGCSRIVRKQTGVRATNGKPQPSVRDHQLVCAWIRYAGAPTSAVTFLVTITHGVKGQRENEQEMEGHTEDS